MLVANWGILRNSGLSLIERERAFANIFRELSPQLNRVAELKLNHLSIIDGEDFVQIASLNIWDKAIREDLTPLPELDNPGQIVNYFRTAIDHEISRKYKKWSRSDAMWGGLDLTARMDEALEDYDHTTQSSLIDFSAMELNLILSRFSMRNPFCAQLLMRWHVTNDGISYDDLKNTYEADYGHISIPALRERNANCKRVLERFINNR